MNKIQDAYLFVAGLSFLSAIALLLFAATDSKSTVAFSVLGVFFALSGAFWVYRFSKGRRTR